MCEQPRAMLGVVSRVLVIQQVRLAEKPHEEGSLLERLVGAAQAVAIRRRAAEEEAAKAAQPILIEARELVGDVLGVVSCQCAQAMRCIALIEQVAPPTSLWT